MMGETPAKLLMGKKVNINMPGLKRPETQSWRTAQQKDKLKSRTDQRNKAVTLLKQSKHKFTMQHHEE